MKRVSWLGALLLVLVSGCQLASTLPPSIPYEGGRIDIRQAWPLEDLYWQQSAVLTTAESEQALLLSSYFRAEESTVVALTLSGHELFRVTWTADSFEVVGVEQLPDERLPYRMIADMQLALWPLASLQRQIQGLRLHESHEPTWERRVNDGQGRTVLTIRAEQAPHLADTILIEHQLYQIEIRTIEREFMRAVHD